MSEPYTKPFSGILYNTDKTGDIAACVCPPYDVIPDVAPYYDRSIYNAIRLELPRPEPPLDPYGTARRTMGEWLGEKVLLRDPKETVYIYEQEFISAGISYLRRGFIALHKLERNRILTHEETRKKAKEDREQLIKTLQTYTSLIFGIYEDKNQEMENILQGCSRETIYDFVDEQAVVNRFYRMSDPGEIETLSRLMDERPIYIADGHHRLDVSYRLGLSYVPLYLTNMYAPGIIILPYHRTVTFDTHRSLKDLLAALQGFAAIEAMSSSAVKDLDGMLREVASSAKGSYVLYSKDDPSTFYLLTERGSLPFEKETPHDSLRRLRVNRLHAGLVKGVLGIRDDEISFTQDAKGAAEEIQRGKIDLALFLPPTTVEEVKDIADHSLFMPPKSTFFYPKILTGLVFYTYG